MRSGPAETRLTPRSRPDRAASSADLRSMSVRPTGTSVECPIGHHAADAYAATLSAMLDELRHHALRLPGTAEGIACAGTALETRTITAGSKAFLFLRDTEIRLKLRDSLPEATARAAEEPDRFAIGAHGWVTIRPPVATAEQPMLARWAQESFRLIASKTLVARLP